MFPSIMRSFSGNVGSSIRVVNQSGGTVDVRKSLVTMLRKMDGVKVNQDVAGRIRGEPSNTLCKCLGHTTLRSISSRNCAGSPLAARSIFSSVQRHGWIPPHTSLPKSPDAKAIVLNSCPGDVAPTHWQVNAEPIYRRMCGFDEVYAVSTFHQ
jgi:hypothetical protein